MKSFGIGFGITGLLLAAVACSDNSVTPATGTGGTAGGTATAGAGSSTGGSASGSPAGGMAGTTTTTAGTGTSGSSPGGSASGGGGTGGVATGGSSTAGGGSGGASGASGAAGASGSGGGGAGGAAACDTKLGKAIKFVGKTTVDMVAGDLGADATLADLPRTLELWAKFTSAESWTAEHTIIELGKPSQPDNGNNVFGIDMSGRNGNAGVFGPYTHGVSDNNGTNAMPQFNAAVDVGWVHLSWSYDPSKTPANTRLEFTVNGDVLPTEFVQAKYDLTGDKLVGNTGYVLLGASQNFGHPGWDGVMDEVRLWSVYRSPQQIKDNMKVIVKPDTAGLTAYYQFNEGDAANVGDSTKKASHKLAACTAAGGACPEANGAAPTFVDSDVPGPFTCAP